MHYSEAPKWISGHITSGVYHPTNWCEIEAQLIMRFEVLTAVNVNPYPANVENMVIS